MAAHHITLRIGELLLVETTAKEMLTGTLKFVDQQRGVIELENVCDQCTGYQYTSTQILALKQITQIKIVRNDESTNSSSNSNSETPTSTKTSDAEEAGDMTNSFKTALQSPLSTPGQKAQQSNEHNFIIPLSSSELQLLQAQLNSVCYIAQTDQRYHRALADIRTQPVVGFLIEPVDYGRAQRTSAMAISTYHTVYIFDILALGSIFRELKQLLEAERPRKAVHYSHKVGDQLQHRHGVKLGGIFDTFVAYALTTGVKEPLTLIETINKTLDIPAMYFQHEEEEKLPYDPYRRPFTNSMRVKIAKQTMFQLKLYEHLLHKHMLANFYNQCSNFANTFTNNHDATVPLEMQPRSQAGFEHIKRKGKWQEILDAEFSGMKL